MTTAVEKPRIALNNILFATDYSDSSRQAMPFATALARHYGSHLLFVHVIEQIPMSSIPMDTLPADIELDRDQSTRKMQEFLRGADFQGLNTETVTEFGFLWPVVAEIVENRKIDLLVLGTRGRGPLKRLLLGSAAEEIFRHVSCPVLTVGPHVNADRANCFGHLQKVLFATDFSAGSSHALDPALRLVAEHDAQLLMVHVVQPSGIPFDNIDTFVVDSEIKLKGMIPAEAMPRTAPLFMTLVGVPSEQVVSFADRENADLIVIGMHKGNEMASHWPEDFAAKVLAHAKCPVLSVRAG